MVESDAQREKEGNRARSGGEEEISAEPDAGSDVDLRTVSEESEVPAISRREESMESSTCRDW